MTKLRQGDPWMPADAYGRTLRGLSLNLVVREIDRSLPFYTDVLGLECPYHDPDFAALSGHGARIMLHADHTYAGMPAASAALGAARRGAGAEVRLLGIDPDRAVQRVEAVGGSVLRAPEDMPHGWRECHLADPDGYIFAVGVATEPPAAPVPAAPPGIAVRPLKAEDANEIMPVLDHWWGGRQMHDRLPKLFFIHFPVTSFAAIEESSGRIIGFVTGFVSQGDPAVAYIHFVGVDRRWRAHGIGRLLYERFFSAVRTHGCTEVQGITSPVNKGSIAFHQHMGFTLLPGDRMVDGIPIHSNYDGRGGEMVLFRRTI